MKKFQSLFLVFSLLFVSACTTDGGKKDVEETAFDPFPQAISSDVCRCSFTVPDHWVKSQQQYENSVIGAESPVSNEFALVFQTSKRENLNLNLEEYAKQVMYRIADGTDQVSTAEEKFVLIGGEQAIQYRVDTVIKDQKSSTIYTFFEKGDWFFQLMTWSDTDIFGASSPTLYRITNSFTFFN